MPTVKQQLVDALEAARFILHSQHTGIPHVQNEPPERCGWHPCAMMAAALARARAEPESNIEPCACDGPECPGYELGLEAQRERV